MQRAILLALVLAVAVGIVLSAWAIWRDGEADIVVEDSTTEPAAPIGSFSIYTSGEHGFMLMYPQDAVVTNGFDSSYHAGTAWRANALPHATGTPVASFIVSDIQNESSFPRYFTAQVRIGVSDDVAEVAQCERAQTEQGEIALPDTSINGVTFKTFSFADAGMMQYVKGVSYRTVRGGACFALERIAAGSLYREAEYDADLTQEELDQRFEALMSIIESFQFVDQAAT